MKNFAEFFAGVGLVREGLSMSNWTCVWANDISQDKQETYIENYGGKDFWLGDIWEIVTNPHIVPDNVFLYTASFPCTDLSVAGGRAGLAGAESGTLNALIEILKNKKKTDSLPKVVLLENVKGFLTSHKGKDVEQTVQHFTELGYFIDIIELDAMDFSAQSRSRVFLIAVEESLAKKSMKVKNNIQLFDEWWTYFEKYPYLRSEKVKRIILGNEKLNWALFDIEMPKRSSFRLADKIEVEIPDNSKLWWNEERKNYIFEQMSDGHKKSLREMTAGDMYSYGTVYRRMRKGKSMAELRTDGFAGCLRTPRGGSSKQILIRAGKGQWKVRLLTPREYARLQGVRDTFILPSSANKGYFAMGDAVSVPVIEFVTNNILDPLYSEHLAYNETRLPERFSSDSMNFEEQVINS